MFHRGSRRSLSVTVRIHISWGRLKQMTRQQRTECGERSAPHLLSRNILNTMRLAASFAARSGLELTPGAAPAARMGNAPRQRAWRSANPSFVPSASTTTVPYQPGSISHAPPGAGPGPTFFGTDMRIGLPFDEGRIVNDERCTHRTTIWCPPCGLSHKLQRDGREYVKRILTSPSSSCLGVAASSQRSPPPRVQYQCDRLDCPLYG